MAKAKRGKLIKNWCKKCNSYFTYRTKEEIVCRHCGHREKI
jgi:DNA-directed RNA polymerase subunit RPC12/RpoP